MDDEGVKKYWKQLLLGFVVLIVVIVGLAWCTAPAKAEEPKPSDPWAHFCLPVTLGYMDDGDLPYGSGLGYTFQKTRVTLMGQIIKMELDGDVFNVPTGVANPPLVQYATPQRDKTAYLVTVVIPFGRR